MLKSQRIFTLSDSITPFGWCSYHFQLSLVGTNHIAYSVQCESHCHVFVCILFVLASCIHLSSVLYVIPFPHKVYRVETQQFYLCETLHNLSLELVLVQHTEVLESQVSSLLSSATTISTPYPLLYLNLCFIVHTFFVNLGFL